jgi:hypothetical protein
VRYLMRIFIICTLYQTFFDKYYRIKEDQMRGMSCMSRVHRWKMCIDFKETESGAVMTWET